MPGDVEEPLLPRSRPGSSQALASETDAEGFGSVVGAEFDVSDGGASLAGEVRLNHATATLAATIIGAGIMALPRAFATLGMVVGGGLLALVFSISLFSLQALVTAARASHCWTYAELAASEFGAAGSTALRAAIVVNNAGSMVIYLIIMGDILCGVAPTYSGLITNLVGVHDPGVVWVSRPFVMAVVCSACLAPLLSLRNLGLLAPMSAAAVGVAGLFVSSVVGLAVVAAAQGQLAPIQWLPAGDALGRTPAEAAVTLIAIVPVIAMSFICHYQLLPVARTLQRLTERRITMVIRRALIICTALFTAVAASGVALFGPATADNILLNLSPEAVSRYLPPAAAAFLCFFIRLGYCLCLMSTFAMLNWALRESVTQAAFGVDMLPGPGFFAVSYAILGAQYATSIAFPSVWTAMSLTGATAAVFLAYILPGALVARAPGTSAVHRVLGWTCVGLGAVMGVVGVFNTLVLSRRGGGG